MSRLSTLTPHRHKAYRAIGAGLMALILVGCGAPEMRPQRDQAVSTPLQVSAVRSDLPPMKRFNTAPVTAPTRSNVQMAQDFMDLSFRLETGATLPVFSRFEGPLSVRVTGAQVPPSLNADLGDLLERLKREAGLGITLVARTSPAAITIELVPAAAFRRRAPNTACIAAPNVSSWAEFRTARHVSWTTVTTRTRAAIFIPTGGAPQEIRDCLHEELAQALGPLNDLFRLPDSVFNDDNFHSVLTGFDMLMLRATYAPELRSGLTRAQVAALIMPLLDRLNPSGRSGGLARLDDTPDDWIAHITRAMDGGALSSRRTAAARAMLIAQNRGWRDTRAGLSYYLFGRLQQGQDTTAARTALAQARSLFAGTSLTEVAAAHATLQLAAVDLVRGDYPTALAHLDPAIATATRAQNAALLSSLMLTKAELLSRMGRAGEARAVRLDSLGWARYGFGSDRDVNAHIAEIQALAR
ncbi:DUF2927 domain-containing protein [Celeribacter marinus]|uniref:DUF2927 domain-containing protein n=1 Tax=Celeribacter marinus TaxID=1397108 RepID=UPI003173A064